jgi:hypothetical protein
MLARRSRAWSYCCVQHHDEARAAPLTQVLQQRGVLDVVFTGLHAPEGRQEHLAAAVPAISGYRLGCWCTFECSISGDELRPSASSEVIQSHSSCKTSHGQCASISHTITCSPATGAAGRARCRLQSNPDPIDLGGRAHIQTTPDCCRRACLHAGARRTTASVGICVSDTHIRVASQYLPDLRSERGSTGPRRRR